MKLSYVIYYLNLATVVMMVLLFMLLLFLVIRWRWLVKMAVKKVGTILLTDNYQENLVEILAGMRHLGVQNVIENSLRASSGDALFRPMGSSKTWPSFDSITFIPAQTTPFPVAGEEDVDMSVTIGPKAKKPMKINIPLMVSGMAYGISLSEQMKEALAKATNTVGTAINSGEGAPIPEEVDHAGKFILQFGKTDWGKDEKLLKKADMIEIKLGQGALFGIGGKLKAENLSERARQEMGLKENETAVIYDNFFDGQTKKDLKELVDDLRKFTGGVPIGMKIGAGGKMEEDLDNILELGVDFITVDGGRGASFGSPPILADDTGIPVLHGLVRAVRHLEKRGVKEEVSLVVSGGFYVPGQFLKALALGADAVYLGSAILFAATHTQNLKALPFEPPTQVVWEHGKYKDQFKVEEGEKAAEQFFTSCVEEMKIGLRAMGKRSLKELSKKDLVSYDELTAKMADIPYSFEPWEQEKG